MISYKMSSSAAVPASILCATLAVSIFSLWWIISKRKKSYIHVGRVSKLFYYPLKSFKGIEVNSVDCNEKGIQVNGFYDRVYMLMSDGAVCCQFEHPRMALLTPSISGNHLRISAPEMEDLVLDLKPRRSPNDKVVSCIIIEEEAQAIDCGDEAAAWFKKFLNVPDVRLVYSAEDLERRKVIKKNRPALEKIRKEHNVSFQNVAPFLLLSQESVDDLNSRLNETTQVSVKNFRPNIVVEGCNAFAEDKWRCVKFSSGAEITHLSPCARCTIVTNDPETGIKTNKEPLVTLRKYRSPKDEKVKANFGPTPLFGVRFGLVTKGKITVGDDVFAVVEHKPFKY